MSYVVYGDGSVQVRASGEGYGSYASSWAEICADCYTSGGTLHYTLTLSRNAKSPKTRTAFYVNGTLIHALPYGLNSSGVFAQGTYPVDANADVKIRVEIGVAKDWLHYAAEDTLVRAKTTYYWTNINVLNPNDVEIPTNGAYFDVNWLDGDRWTNLTNEPVPAVYKPHGAYLELHHIRPFEGYVLEKVTGVTPHPSTPGVYCKTITDESEIDIHLAYKTYTMNYNPNGGSGAPSAETFIYVSDYKISTTAPKRSGYNFLGWSTSADAVTATYTPGQKWSDYDSESITLYAVWVAVHKITFDGNGGGINGNDYITQNATNGTIATNFPIAEKRFHQFVGWNTVQDGSGEFLTTIKVMEDITLYAIYQAESNCYVKRNGNYQRGIAYVRRNGTYCRAVKIRRR